MSIKRRPCAEALVLAVALSGAAHAAEPSWAGLELAGFTLPGLTLKEHQPDLPERGGSQRIYADAAGEVRVVIRVAVAAEARSAAKVVERWLFQMTAAVEPGAHDTLAIGHSGNLAYEVLILPAREGAEPLPKASELVAMLLARAVPGRPTAPTLKLQLVADASVKRAARVELSAPEATRVVLRPQGGYLVETTKDSSKETRVHAWGTEPVGVEGVVEDALGRVSAVSAVATVR